MINRFRFEASGTDKDELQDELALAAGKIISAANATNGVLGTWECTDEAITGKPGNYKGRMVFIYRGPVDVSVGTRIEVVVDGD